MHHRLVRQGRVAAMIVAILILLTVYVYELYDLQIIEGEKYYNQSNEITNEERAVTAARGNILDRYGRVLVDGHNFTECSVIYVDGESYPTAFVSSSEIVAIVPRTTPVSEVCVAQVAPDGTEMSRTDVFTVGDTPGR